MKKVKILSVTLALMMCVSLFAACSNANSNSTLGAASTAADGGTVEAHEPGLFVDGEKLEADPVLTINGEDISFDEYRYYYLSTRVRFDGGDVTLWEDASAEESKPVLLQYVLESIESMMAFEQMAKEHNITLTDDELKTVTDSIADAKEQLGGDTAYEEALAEMYYTPELYEKMLTENLLASKVIKEVYGDEIKADIEANYLHAKHILILSDAEEGASSADASSVASSAASSEASSASSEASSVASSEAASVDASAVTSEAIGDTVSTALATAQDVKKQLDEGASFDELMTIYNQDPGETADGYYFKEGDMVTEFYEGTLALAEGEISEPIESSYGYHIIERLPLDDAYIEQNMVNMMSEEMSQKIDEDVIAIMDTMQVTYCDNYDKIAPDTMF